MPSKSLSPALDSQRVFRLVKEVPRSLNKQNKTTQYQQVGKFVGKYWSGKLFPLILFSVTVPVCGRFLGWFPLPGLPWIPPLPHTASAPH